MGNIKGSKDHPYMYFEYESMAQGHVWYGGWVILSDSKEVYITGGYSIEQDNDDGILGSEENPFSETAYDEMMVDKTWPGGNVQFGDVIMYARSYAEQSSACSWGSGSCPGNGTGCGSGDSYVQMGVEDIITTLSGRITIKLFWNSGYTNKIPYSYLSIHVFLKPPYIEVSNTLTATWEPNYKVRIGGEYQYKSNSGNSIQTFTIDGDPIFDIPEMYKGRPY